MKFQSLSITGPKGQNQDKILAPFSTGDSTWCAIADGVGSAAMGSKAAQTSLAAVELAASEKANMKEVFRVASRELLKLVVDDINPKSLSTTLSVLCVKQHHAWIGHVGDTRITHLRGGGVMTRTRDQTEVQQLLDEGALSKHQARRYPRRNILLSVLSAGRDYDLFLNEFDIESGDRILLTSDGFHSKIFRPRLASISEKNTSFQDFWHEVKACVSQENFDDDASCLAIEF